MGAQLHTKRQDASLNPGQVRIDLKIPIGASGATGTIVGRGATCVKNTTGVYDLTFDRGFKRLVSFDGSCIAAAGALNHPVLKADYTAGSTALQFQTVVQAGTATEPASGDKILLTIVMDDIGL